MNTKFIPYAGFLAWWLIFFLSTIKNNPSHDFMQAISMVFFGVILGTALSSATYLIARKKYSPKVAWVMSFFFWYWCIAYLKLMLFIFRSIIGGKGSAKTASSAQQKSGHTMSAEANIKRLNSELAMYQQKYEEGMRSPSKTDNEYSATIHQKLINEKKNELKYWEDRLK